MGTRAHTLVREKAHDSSPHERRCGHPPIPPMRQHTPGRRGQGGAVPVPVYTRSPPPDRHPEHDYDASDAWVADLASAALAVLRVTAVEMESVAAELAALERRVSWEGPAAREFRRRSDALRAGGTASATALDALVDDVRALRTRLWLLTQDAPRGG